MDINGKRLIDDLKALREMTDTPGEGVTRFSYGENDRKARAYIKKIADDFGFSYECDGVGNVIIAPKESRRFFYIGSHIDTVRNGGWLDGIYGVMSGMELLRTLQENGCRHDIGKTIVGAMMTASGYDVYDLGTDIENGIVIEKVKEIAPDVLGLSALLTTTMEEQKKIIEMMDEQGLRDDTKVIIGGAPVSQVWADKIGADGYSDNAIAAVKLADKLCSRED